MTLANLKISFKYLGLCISYDDLERVNMCQTQQLIKLAGSCRVPVPENIKRSSIIHGTTENVDHENTSFGVGGSHDTILVLFQKSAETEINEEISCKPEDIATLPPNKH